tara:strand:+ start:946 stop:1728 length:783 start_codon:yes stop_codon:yes gene_type:complete
MAYRDNCCCSPTGITGMKAGLHPDHIETAYIEVAPGADAAAWKTRTQVISLAPIHIIGGSISFYAKFPSSGNLIPETWGSTTEEQYYNSLPLNVSLVTADYTHDAKDKGGFIMPENSTADTARKDFRNYIFTTALNPQNPHVVLPEHLWGLFCDGGLYVETQGAHGETAGARVVIQYIARSNFTPAYADPVVNSLARWDCMNPETDFLDNFYGGMYGQPGQETGDTVPGTDDGDPDDDTTWTISSVGTVPTTPSAWSLPT